MNTLKNTNLTKRKILGVAVFLFVLVASYFYFAPSSGANPLEEQYNSLSTQTAKKLFYVQSQSLTKPVPPELVEWDEKTIGCFGTEKIMTMDPSDENLGGQCCGALKDIDSYHVQLQALSTFIEEHDNLDVIPRNPYDVSVKDAQKLISFDRDIALNAEQQNVYDEAMGMSHHGGPCCCKCWKWTMMSGLAKKLIADHDFSAENVAELWDTASSCGHDEDTNLHTHYSHQQRGMDHEHV